MPKRSPKRSSHASACLKKYGPLMLSVDLRYTHQGLIQSVTHMMIDDKECKKVIWEDHFDGHDIQQGKSVVLQRAMKFLDDQHRGRPDPDDDRWKCSDELGKPVGGLG